MSATLLSIALQLVRTWVGIYTLGLPRTHRHQRIELIQADLSDQLADMTQAGASQAQLALSLITRSLRGLPDDVTWRLFEARRLPGENSAITLDRRPIMAPRTPGAAFFAIATGLTWAAALVLAVEPVAHSLAYAGGLVAAIALTAWALEARGTPDDETTASVWPLLLAVGIVAIAGGVVFDGGRSGLLLVTPLALGMSTAFARVLLDSKREFADAVAVQPLPYSELARHAAEGDAIAIESTPQRGVTRRAVLRGSFVLGAASVLATTGGIVVDFLWQRNVAGFGGIVTAGKTSDFPPGSKTIVRTGKFWLVNLTAAQGGPGYLALWQKCPHLGCVVPWDESFSHIDPDTGRPKEGWFRCPCHQSTYNDAGVRVFGPAPRSMDRMALRVTEDGLIEVDTSDISKGADNNATFAIRP